MGEHPFRRRPALRVALLLIAGIIAAETLDVNNPSLFFYLAIGSVLVLAVAWWRPSTSSLALHVLPIVLSFSLHSLGVTEKTLRDVEPETRNDIVSVTGVLESLPQQSGNSTRVVIGSASLIKQNGETKNGRRLITTIRKGAYKPADSILSVGTRIMFRAEILPYPKPRNPGEFDYGRYLRLNDIDGIVAVRKNDTISVLSSTTAPSFTATVVSFRAKLVNVFNGLHSLPVAAFLRGIILADRSDIAPEIKESFINTGTIHVLAVSGLHVGIVAIVFFAVFGLLRVPRNIRPLLMIVALTGYMVLIGSAPSVVRATVMASVILFAQLLERKPDTINSIAVAALALLVWDSNQLMNVGFQLSFSAVLSIVLLYPVLENLIHRIPERFEEVKAIDYALKLCAVSLAAQLGTLPFTAYYFERISLISLVANVIVVPLIGIVVMVGFAAITFSFWPFMASIFAEVNELLVRIIFGFVETASKVPYAYFEITDAGVMFPVFFYLTLLLLVSLRKPHLFKYVLMLALVVGNAFAFYHLVWEEKPALRITAIDVGQGDAILIEFPNRSTILVDAGPRSLNYDAGERIVLPFLKRKGIRSLDYVVLSHPHSDHIGGVAIVLKNLNVSNIADVNAEPRSNLHRELREVSREKGIPPVWMKSGDRIEPDTLARAYVLYPSFPRDSSSNLNNTSVVVKIVYGTNVVLLIGDAEKEAEEKLVKRYGSFLKSDLLKVGHHGSVTSTSDKLLDYVAPAYAIVSVGLNNKFRHPSSDVLSRLQERNVTIVRTDDEGAALFVSDGRSLNRIRWRN